MPRCDIMEKAITILSIESSCDETGVAIVQRPGDALRVLVNVLSSQVDIHRATGGVVPEFAAREHASIIQPLIKKAIGESKLEPGDIDAIAVTIGPGLQPALAIGVVAAQALAYAWHKPIVPVHHLEGHIYSAFVQPKISAGKLPTTHYSLPTNSFPALALIVSGGHTQLVRVPKHLTYEVIGATRDDAAGEAFDKVARLLGLPYPGGLPISALAEQGNPGAFKFTRPMLRSHDLDFSFSGLKTEVLYTLRDNPAAAAGEKADLAASFEQAVVDTLVSKTRTALDRTSPRVLLAAGGVLANSKLRRALKSLGREKNVELRLAPLSLCGDNAVMIGQAALFAYSHGRRIDWHNADAAARLPLASISERYPAL